MIKYMLTANEVICYHLPVCCNCTIINTIYLFKKIVHILKIDEIQYCQFNRYKEYIKYNDISIYLLIHEKSDSHRLSTTMI